MSTPSTDTLALAQALIRCRSVTPDEGGALALLQGQLEQAGFDCHRLPFSDEGTPDVDNLFARIGTGSPHLCFAGHTDVVPTGDEAQWRHPPFDAAVADGALYGRGASDMKGAIAAFVSAALGFLADGAPKGSISFLITGDEEGPAVNGTAKALAWLEAQGHTPDHCLVGEPSNPQQLGEAIKIGRRGSLNATLTVTGAQGHVAYPDLAKNPIPGLLSALGALDGLELDDGTSYFMPSNLELTGMQVANSASNVIPAAAEARFNIRFNERHSSESLKVLVRKTAAEALEGSGLEHDFVFDVSGESFMTEPGDIVDIMIAAVKEVTDWTPELSTSGGTSDARFIKDYCPVIEFGLTTTTIHKVDEHVTLADLEGLTKIYRRFIERYFKTFA